jgi:hypothetical protein
VQLQPAMSVLGPELRRISARPLDQVGGQGMPGDGRCQQ